MEQILIIEDDMGLNQGLCLCFLKFGESTGHRLSEFEKRAPEQLACGSVSPKKLLDITAGSGVDLFERTESCWIRCVRLFCWTAK